MQTVQTVEPAILTANCYFWHGGANAATRRRNEERHQAAVAAWLESLGFDVTRAGDVVVATGHGLRVVFSYNESCANVYKSLLIQRDGKRSNITALRKLTQ